MMDTNLKTKYDPEIGDYFYYKNELMKVTKKTKNSKGDRFIRSDQGKYALDDCEYAGFSEKDLESAIAFTEFLPSSLEPDIIEALEILGQVDNKVAAEVSSSILSKSLDKIEKSKAWEALPKLVKERFLNLKNS